MNNFLYFVLGVVAWQILRSLYLILEIELRKRRERRFLNLVSITLPNHGAVTFISADTSDKKSMAKLEKDLRDRFDQPS